MKKIFVYTFLTMTLCFSLTGCAEKKQSNTNTNRDNTQSQVTNDNTTQSEPNNSDVQEMTVDISIKDWIEAVSIDGVNWTEFSEADVTNIFGNLDSGDEVQNAGTISFTDVNGQTYTGTIRHEETREGEVILRYMPENNSDDFAVRFELEKNSAEVHLLDGIRISTDKVAPIKDILTTWGVDKIDVKAFEMATNLQNANEKEYSFRCTTDYGGARISVENDLNDEGYREIDVNIDFEDTSVPYNVELMEVYEGENSEKVRYFEIYLDKDFDF